MEIIQGIAPKSDQLCLKVDDLHVLCDSLPVIDVDDRCIDLTLDEALNCVSRAILCLHNLEQRIKYAQMRRLQEAQDRPSQPSIEQSDQGSGAC
jgi:hypothetical protein